MFRPGERVVTPYGMGIVIGPSLFGATWLEVQLDNSPYRDHFRPLDMVPADDPRDFGIVAQAVCAALFAKFDRARQP